MEFDWTAPATAYTAEQLYQAFKSRMRKDSLPPLTPEQLERIEKFLDEAEDDNG